MAFTVGQIDRGSPTKLLLTAAAALAGLLLLGACAIGLTTENSRSELVSLPDSRKQAAAGSCKTEHDCGLAGDCSGGKCDCDAAWTGPTCTRLALMPTAEESGMRRASHASWGGSVRPTLATASPW